MTEQAMIRGPIESASTPAGPIAQCAPDDRVRDLLRRIYLPYTWLVFIPFLVVTTVVLGIIAVLICLVSPRLAFHCGTLWSWMLCRVNFTWVRVRGRQNLQPDQSYIIMSNHQSHFDVLALYGHWGRQFRWVMKEELRRVPGLGWYCQAGGHVFIDRSSPARAFQSLERAKPLLRGGISLMFFPEGTRSRDGRMRELKKGGFIMAQDLALPILPVSISGSRHVLPGKSLALLPGCIRIQIHPPIDTACYGVERRDQMVADVRAAIASGLPAWERGEQPSPATKSV